MQVNAELFEKVSAIVGDKTIPPQRTASYAEKLQLYGLYKRATVGKLLSPFGDDDIETESRPVSRPGLLSFEARSKYDAWAETDAMTKQDARDAYVKLAEDIVGQPVLEAIQQCARSAQ